MAAELAREIGDIERRRKNFRRAREHAQALAKVEPNPGAGKAQFDCRRDGGDRDGAVRPDRPVAPLVCVAQATEAEAATPPTSLTTERQGMAVRPGCGADCGDCCVGVPARRARRRRECGAHDCGEAIEGFRGRTACRRRSKRSNATTAKCCSW